MSCTVIEKYEHLVYTNPLYTRGLFLESRSNTETGMSDVEVIPVSVDFHSIQK